MLYKQLFYTWLKKNNIICDICKYYKNLCQLMISMWNEKKWETWNRKKETDKKSWKMVNSERNMNKEKYVKYKSNREIRKIN